MNDVFNEQLVARRPNQKDLLQKIGIGVAGAVLIFLGMNVPALMSFVVPIIAVVIVGVVFLFFCLDVITLSMSMCLLMAIWTLTRLSIKAKERMH